MSATERRAIRQVLTDHPWTPGTYGKGVVTRSGRVWTWEEDAGPVDFESMYGGRFVHHADVMAALGMRWSDEAGAFYVNEAGEVEWDGVPPRLRPKVLAYIEQRR